MGKMLVAYATRKGATRNIAELIAEGIRIDGGEAEVKNVTEVKKDEDLAGYDGYVLGSATYHGEMMQGMKTMLFLAEKAGLKGTVGGSFGACGWSGEAPGRIFDTMEHILEMNMVSGPLRLKSAALGGGTQMAQDYGKEIGKKLSTS
ncbi:MAG: flavodoxin domain-containing protein [Deltaproteobacteria bacterium]|nr:flavodoxin domain-containing protein [Deltaproteobacteria bacterium]